MKYRWTKRDKQDFAENKLRAFSIPGKKKPPPEVDEFDQEEDNDNNNN